MTHRRGTVLFAVLLIVSIAIVIGTGVALTTDARRTSISGSLARMQTRALAWSGVQGAVAELADQRPELLRGGDPQLLSEWEVTVDGRRVMVRLIPIGGEGVFAVSESARLNVNAATPEMLAALGEVGEQGAAEIEAMRNGGDIGSIEQIALVRRGAGAAAGISGAEAPEVRAGPGGEAPVDLRSVLTTFSADPNLLLGLGERGSEFAGFPRIDIGQSWSEALAETVRRRFDEDAAAILRSSLSSGRTLESDTALIRAMVEAGIPAEDWAPLIDGVTTSPDPFQIGRVDINRADAAVLACIPGVDAEAAASIVEARARLGAEALRNPAWPVVEGLIEPAAFAAASPWVTTRTMQWRVRVEAGFAAPGVNGREARDSREELEHRTVLEAVLDLSSNRPVVAYLRDVTYLPVLQRVAIAALTADQPVERTTGLDNPAPFVDANRVGAEAGAQTGPPGAGGRERMDFGDLEFGGPAEADGADAGDAAAKTGEPPAEGGGVRREGRDRRIGRWINRGSE